MAGAGLSPHRCSARGSWKEGTSGRRGQQGVSVPHNRLGTAACSWVPGGECPLPLRFKPSHIPHHPHASHR